MTDEHEFDIVSDGQGIALFGEGKELDLFLKREGLVARPLEMARVAGAAGKASSAVNGIAQASLNAGRWVKLSEKSAKAMKTSGMMKGSTDKLVRGIFTGDKSKITGIAEFVKPGAAFANPMVLANVSGMMTQMALQQSIDEIAEYLAVIDAKIDDIIRVQKDSVIADMIGVGFVIDEAMTIRAQMGKVSDVTWSKVQATSFQLARTQAYVLLQLDDISTKLGKEKSIAALVKASQDAQQPIAEWLAVLARCSQLNDAVGVLELDRVLDSNPEDVEGHRTALNTARQQRLDLITSSTAGLITRVEALGAYANGKLLLNPFESPAVIKASNTIGSRVEDFQRVMEIGENREELTARLWGEAALELRDDVVETSKRIGTATVDGTKKTVEASKKALEQSKKALSSAKDAVQNSKEVHEASKQALDASKQALEESKKALGKGSKWIAERAAKLKRSE
ncbi:ElaB/YqjD/DUF883 family membrane-anchored ribosome-binding protein [Aurantimicrobium minutum]|uniref:hypothetical protein n=1 Tax=Aurantimicrobium minutum TaxID=708131 RepID=UPI002475F412|nr:hypothetical protein [Aurantimicrobium minutum]MDH6277632.1 ElaB/YqjD/DUF883 family membrane-anchored ribosome-binding protein [Aurantimicrobium minutum]